MAYMSTNTGGGTPTKAEDADANTKVQVEESADENKIRFDTAGSERMIIDETGKVGIGTSTPGATLDVAGTALFGTLTGNYGTAPRALNLIGSAAVMRIARTGTDDPAIELLHLSANGNQQNSYWDLFTDETTFKIRTRLQGTAPSDSFSDVNALTILESNQNVGIGTVTPAAKLHVDGDARFRASVEVCTSDPAPANTETGTIYQFTKGSAGVFTLPASPPVGTQFVLVNGDGQDIVITRPHSSVKINGATSNATNTTAYAATSIVAVVSNGNNSEWLAFGGI